MRRRDLIFAGLAVPLALASGDGGADCRSPAFAWSDTRPSVNLRHVFCGDIADGRPLGLHSSRLAGTSDAVRGLGRRRDEGGGVYSAIVRFANGTEKLSTFFPDACTVGAVVQSIAYAANHPARRHPAWGELGPSAPMAGARGYCLDDRGEPLLLRFARLRDGRVNTAFPDGDAR